MSTNAGKRRDWKKRVARVLFVLAAIATLLQTYMAYQERQDRLAKSSAPSLTRSAEDLYLAGSTLQHQGHCREAIDVFKDALNQVHTETLAGQHQAALINFSLGQCYLQTSVDCKEVSRYLGALTGDEAGLYGVLRAEYDNAPCK